MKFWCGAPGCRRISFRPDLLQWEAHATSHPQSNVLSGTYRQQTLATMSYLELLPYGAETSQQGHPYSKTLNRNDEPQR